MVYLCDVWYCARVQLAMLVPHWQAMALLPLRHWCILQSYDVFRAGCLGREGWQQICIYQSCLCSKSDRVLQRGSLLSSIVSHLALLRPTPVQLWLLLHADIPKGPLGAGRMVADIQSASCWGLGHLSDAKLNVSKITPRQSFDIVVTQI